MDLGFWIHNLGGEYEHTRYEPMIGRYSQVSLNIKTSLNLRQPAVDKAAVELCATLSLETPCCLRNISCDAAETSTARWKKLGSVYGEIPPDGNVSKEENGKFQG